MAWRRSRPVVFLILSNIKRSTITCVRLFGATVSFIELGSKNLANESMTSFAKQSNRNLIFPTNRRPCRSPRPDLVGFTRRNFLVPVPRVSDLAKLNEELARRCQADLERQVRGQSVPKIQLLEEERHVLCDFPKQTFDAYRIDQAYADSLSLMRFDRNSYSVPTKYAYRQMTIIATVDEVRLVFEDQLVARHARDWGKEQFIFNPVHYLALLERKPGGFDFARPLEDWDLPVSFGILRRRLEAELGGLGTREFIKTLRLLEHHPLAALKQAVQRALEIGATSPDAIRLILDYQQEEPIGLFSLDGRPHLKLVHVQPTDVSAYQSLLFTSPSSLEISS